MTEVFDLVKEIRDLQRRVALLEEKALVPLHPYFRSHNLSRIQRQLFEILYRCPADSYVSVHDLVDAVYGEYPPSGREDIIRSHILILRKRLGRSAIKTHPGGYSLTEAPRLEYETMERARVSAD